MKKKITKTVLDLSNLQARKFFLEHENYCNFDLPPYIKFDEILKKIDKLLRGKNLSDFYQQNQPKSKKLLDCCEENQPPKIMDDINCTILHNKDGKYAWRPLQLIHPALYVSFVHNITEEENWEIICQKFEEFKTESHIQCMSIPVKSSKSKKNKSEQILSWWDKFEQQSITMSLDYEYLTNIDISNCYGSIYTHSIPWAIHGKDEAKKNKNDKKLLGNKIDTNLRQISGGQTNGIPQGSVLMDFIAEMVLGYIDCELTKKIKIKNYDIIRYRDDYRIFTHNLSDGEQIVKLISEVLIDFRMSLNPNKTKPTDQVIKGSIKPDKLYWMQQKQKMNSLQKTLLIIHSFAMKFPNSGQLMRALGEYYQTLKEIKLIQEIKDVNQLISIVIDIAYHNPRTYFVSAAVLSELISYIDNRERQTEIIEKIVKKFKRIPNTGHLNIWLQRVTIGFNESINFNEIIRQFINNKNDKSIWKSNWLKESFRKEIEDKLIIDQQELNAVKGKPIAKDEFDIFFKGYY